VGFFITFDVQEGPSEFIDSEHQLAHAAKGPLGRAYNRTSHLPERTKMMQQWADYLDEIKINGVKPGAMVIQIGERVA